MILSDLKSYLAEHRHVPIGDLVNHFASEPEAIRGMLEHFAHKGLVRRLDGGGTCGGCRKCDAYAFEIYEWTGR
ncbi:MAG: FeoC-like transcriptional regulator [Pseudomonadota bacterium]